MTLAGGARSPQALELTPQTAALSAPGWVHTAHADDVVGTTTLETTSSPRADEAGAEKDRADVEALSTLSGDGATG